MDKNLTEILDELKIELQNSLNADGSRKYTDEEIYDILIKIEDQFRNKKLVLKSV